MDIFPAIDIKNGQVVRLTQGDYNRVDVYTQSPVEAVQAFAAQGARFLHVVDLDGAKEGALSNFETVREIVRASHLFVEVGGGIRDEARVAAYLELGVNRVILGTAALQNRTFLANMVKRYGASIAVGVDARDGKVASHGWLNVSAIDSLSFCGALRDMGVACIIYTDIARDGAMQGVNAAVYEQLCKAVGQVYLTASGGVSTLDDIRILKTVGVQAAIVGKALYTGALRLPDVLGAAQREDV